MNILISLKGHNGREVWVNPHHIEYLTPFESVGINSTSTTPSECTAIGMANGMRLLIAGTVDDVLRCMVAAGMNGLSDVRVLPG